MTRDDVRAWAAKVAAEAPTLTTEQRARLAVLLHPQAPSHRKSA